jgi:hypothetical protein
VARTRADLLKSQEAEALLRYQVETLMGEVAHLREVQSARERHLEEQVSSAGGGKKGRGERNGRRHAVLLLSPSNLPSCPHPWPWTQSHVSSDLLPFAHTAHGDQE